MVGGATLGALGGVLDAGGGGHEHEPRHALGRRQPDVQRDAPTQRVAAQAEALGGACEHVPSAAGECDRLPAHPARVGVLAVPGQVQRQRSVAFGG